MEHESGPGSLHVSLQRLPEEIFEPDSVAEAPLVRFVAYTRHHRVFGWVRLRADRLTDLLNAHDSLVLTDVQIEAFEDGEPRSVDRVLLTAAELVAVHASGPRGDAALRRRTRSHAIALQVGHYLVGGHLHAEPGADPLASLRDRPPMIPLTDAWIEYWSGGTRIKQAIGTIIVNRLGADWIRVVSDEDLVDGTILPTPGVACP
ncbi:MAG: hypothetical protein AB1627_16720 [Chloroflexota bacterium]